MVLQSISDQSELCGRTFLKLGKKPKKKTKKLYYQITKNKFTYNWKSNWNSTNFAENLLLTNSMERQDLSDMN